MSEDPPRPKAPASTEPHLSYPARRDPRITNLKDWILRHESAYTDAALESAALAAGYTHEEYAAADALADEEELWSQMNRSTRMTARWVILGAYGLVWAFFAVPYLTSPTMYGFGPIAQGILTVTLGIALLGSWVWTRRNPDPASVGRAMATLLSVPMVFLLVVGGLCLPFLPQ